MFPVIDIAGPAHERGRLHGMQAHARIERSIGTYARLFAYCGIDWPGAQKLAAGYRDLVGDFDAALLAEIEGIAVGAGRHVNEILALNTRTEILPPTYPGEPHADWKKLAAANARAGVPQLNEPLRETGSSLADGGECTAIAVAPASSTTGTTLLAQNWDWLGAQRAALILLRIREADGASCLTLTEAGMLAKIGFNDRGFGVCLNILRSTEDGRRTGIPVHVLLRRLLRCGDVAEAVRLAAGLAYGASSNVLCADASGDSAALECSPRGLALVRGTQSPLCHTNHFLAPQVAGQQIALAPSLSTVPRLERIRAIVADHAGRFSPADLEAALRDESAGTLSICRRPDPALPLEVRLETVASVVMNLGARIMHVAPDVPSSTEYQPVALAAESVLA